MNSEISQTEDSQLHFMQQGILNNLSVRNHPSYSYVTERKRTDVSPVHESEKTENHCDEIRLWGEFGKFSLPEHSPLYYSALKCTIYPFWYHILFHWKSFRYHCT
jgi:hypothetical protein